MSVFLQQLPALIGVVVGALGSYLAVVRSDRARFRQETAVRWEERRLTVYTEYARTLKASVTLAYRIAAHLGNDPHPHPLAPREAAAAQAEAALDRDPASEALLMLGSRTVVDKARAWAATVLEMERFLRGAVCEPDAWQELLERQRAAREGYYAAVREDLALAPGHGARRPLPPVTDIP
ncbi:hypothetical protein [Streptomyces mayonensis]|uniref:hypothetical protein n=1 Tax=Streptomyces mayonensis TaxID=2750816 RepID=UPI001C1E35A4|nr:hypothetical protein [Streptomyces sp. A108]MBU6535925.1 hypothetical protein [Streptomyces sp. A108]